jgi:RNA polymerase sigma-70 factor (ECF subfamily)
VVQEAMTRVFRRIEHFEPQRQQALRAYLRRAVMNRIRDEIRSSRRRGAEVDVEDVDLTVPASLFDHLVDREREARYREGLSKLRPEDREAIVARLELGYTYEQVAIATGRPTPEAARLAIRRALLRLAEVMSAD